MIFAKEFERLIRRWFAFVNKGIDPSLACRHAALIVLPIIGVD
jgi:hypothetical protein